jgi:ribonuclease HI
MIQNVTKVLKLVHAKIQEKPNLPVNSNLEIYDDGYIIKTVEDDVAPYRVQQPDHEEEKKVILKVDGSLLRKISSAGCGGYLSSASEKWICGFTQKLKFTPTIREDETEREAILRGLLWVKEKGKKKVVVKTDNKGNADLVNSGGRSTDPVICGIRDLLKSKQWEASLSWISRGENDVADKLAQKAHSFISYDLQEFDCPPQNCLLN